MLYLDWASLLSGSVVPEARIHNACLSSESKVCPLLLSEEQKKHLVAPTLLLSHVSRVRLCATP